MGTGAGVNLGGAEIVSRFREIDPVEITDNAIKLIGHEWMMVTAGVPDRYNTMTASWGGLGWLWGFPACFCFVRPQRYTYGFMEEQDVFTLSFLPLKYRPQLNFCGSRSGREVDKAKECGFTPAAAQNGSVYFDEARLVLECRKLYFQDLDPKKMLDPSLLKNYPKDDFHRMYMGEITRVLTADA